MSSVSPPTAPCLMQLHPPCVPLTFVRSSPQEIKYLKRELFWPYASRGMLSEYCHSADETPLLWDTEEYVVCSSTFQNNVCCLEGTFTTYYTIELLEQKYFMYMLYYYLFP